MVRAKPGRLKAPRRRQRKTPWLMATVLSLAATLAAAAGSKVGPIRQKYSKQSSAAVKEILGDLPDYSTTFTQAQFNEWITVLKTVVPNFQDTVTYQQLAAGLS